MMLIAGLLKLVGWIHPPTWVLWTIWGIGAVALIISFCATFGVSIPTWLAYALLAAKTIAV
jgi:hypothetical protein